MVFQHLLALKALQYAPYLTGLLLAWGVLGTAGYAQDPGWTVSGSFARTMNIVATLTIDGVTSTGGGDKVAAIVGNEVRGVANDVASGTNRFFLSVGSNTTGGVTETITFQVYDASANTVRNVSESVTFVSGGLLGSPDPLALFAGDPLTQIGNDPTQWTVNASSFQGSMSLVAKLSIDGTAATSGSYQIAAFVGSEVRGVLTTTSPDAVTLSIHGNTTDNNREVSFRVQDTSTGRVFRVLSKLPFQFNSIPGALTRFDIAAVSNFTRRRLVNPDWTQPTFQHAMSVVAQVSVGGVLSSDANDRLAAFVGMELRGVAAPDAQNRYFLAIGSNLNAAEAYTEKVRFCLYDASANMVLDLPETFTFENNALKGNLSTPLSLATTPPVALAISVVLAGAHSNSGTMNTTLRSNGHLSQNQPFNDAGFNGTSLAYDGTETVSSLPTNVVDWVMVELRADTAQRTRVARRPALLLADGTITDLSGSGPLLFPGLDSGTYRVIIRHRNHLPIMTSIDVDLGSSTTDYNFKTGTSQAFGSGALIEVEAGVFAMIPGDADGNGQIQNSDKNNVWRLQVGQSGYRSADFDMNGEVQNSDKNLIWRLHVGKGSQVPDDT